ncbi:MAG TPA: hypothetical protein VMJ90_02045 [Anaerolineales bacterium]|nr:hypothetical protein [Anaerolineales bacterium]
MFENLADRLVHGQERLTNVNSLETLRHQFNDDVGQIRLVILLNPT